MRRLSLLALVLIAACSDAVENPAPQNDASSNRSGENSLAPPAIGRPDGLAGDQTRDAEGTTDPRGPQGATRVLQSYFALLEAGRYPAAHRLWWNGGRASGMSPVEFATSFGKYAEYHAKVGTPSAIEGAAGSAYIDVPVQVYGLLKGGEPFNAAGTMTLRRVNDVPGSTAEQRQWRIYRSAIPRIGVATTPSLRFVGRWASDERACASRAWRFTQRSLETPAGSVCRFSKVTNVPGGYDIAARCTAEGPPVNDVLKLRFAESARALLFESRSIADAGLVACSSS